MALTYRTMTAEDKRAVCAWRYPGEYAVYDLPDYDEMCRMNASFVAAEREKNFVSFLEGDELIGFVNLLEEPEEVFVGIGVHPQKCGGGYGQQMLRMACDLSKTQYPGKPLYLEVRTWNARAVRCYEKAGFVIDGEPFTQVTGAGNGVFYRMIRK